MNSVLEAFHRYRGIIQLNQLGFWVARYTNGIYSSTHILTTPAWDVTHPIKDECMLDRRLAAGHQALVNAISTGVQSFPQDRDWNAAVTEALLHVGDGVISYSFQTGSSMRGITVLYFEDGTVRASCVSY